MSEIHNFFHDESEGLDPDSIFKEPEDQFLFQGSVEEQDIDDDRRSILEDMLGANV